MSRYEIDVRHEHFREVAVGRDEATGTLYMQCPWRKRPGLKRVPMLWYPRIETMRELDLLLRWHRITLPEVMIRQLAGELSGRLPDVLCGDHVWLDGPERSCHLVLQAQTMPSGRQRLLLEQDQGEGPPQWAERERVDLDPERPTTPDEIRRLVRHRDTLDAPPPVDEELEALLDAICQPTDEDLEQDAQLLERLLATGGLFPR